MENWKFTILSEKTREDIESMAKNKFSETQIGAALETMEKLMMIDVPRAEFDEKYGNKLNQNPLSDANAVDMESLAVTEGFLKKLAQIMGKTTEYGKCGDDYEVRIGNLYNWAGFYDLLNLQEVKEARKNDSANAQNWDNTQGISFSIHDADPGAYTKCENCFQAYLYAYRYRTDVAHDFSINTPQDRMMMLAGQFLVFIDVCLRHKEIIDLKYDEFLDKGLNYIEYAQEMLRQRADRVEAHKHFTQLSWNETVTELDPLIGCIKFTGDPGAGKTFQMEELYLQLLKKVSEGTVQCLPVWLNLPSTTVRSEEELLSAIAKEAPGFENHVARLRKSGRLVLFLDGHNEILNSDNKKEIARIINFWKKNFPKMHIHVTDRIVSYLPMFPKGTKGVTNLQFYGMSLGKRKEYVRNYNPNSQLISEMSTEAYEWMDNILVWTPERMNVLLELDDEGIEVEDDVMFTEKYLESIIRREREIKLDDNAYAIKHYLKMLTEGRVFGDTMSEFEIVNKWSDNKATTEATKGAMAILRLAEDMGILKQVEDEVFQFDNETYFQYFANRR